MDLFHFPFCHLSTLFFRLSPVPYFRLSVPFQREHFSLGSGITRVSWNIFLSLKSNCHETNPNWILVRADTVVSEALVRFLIGRIPFDVITAVRTPTATNLEKVTYRRNGTHGVVLKIKLSIWCVRSRRDVCKCGHKYTSLSSGPN
jgi:hypothetical protein